MKKVDKKEVLKKGGKFFGEFKEFIAKGDVLDLAVGVVIGSAFTAIVTSIVENLLTPIIGLFMPDTAFKDWAPGGFGVGAVINAIISFLITALVVFLIIKIVTRFTKKFEKEQVIVVEEEPKKDPQIELLEEIRDLLKNKE